MAPHYGAGGAALRRRAPADAAARFRRRPGALPRDPGARARRLAGRLHRNARRGDFQDVAAFAGMAAAEALLGALLAFGVLTAFAAFQLAGRLLDLQLGFGVATLIDPATRGHAPLLGTLLSMAGVALFF